MSLIVAYKANNRVYFGSDSITSGDINYAVKTPKIIRYTEEENGLDAIICSTGSWPILQLLNSNIKFKKKHKKDSSSNYINSVIIPELKEKILESNTEIDFEILIAIKSKLFVITHHDEGYNFTSHELIDNYFAIGCGADFAIGAMNILSQGNLKIKEMINKALCVGAKYTGMSMPPYIYMNT